MLDDMPYVRERLFSIEGIDGAGKSTALDALRRLCEEKRAALLEKDKGARFPDILFMEEPTRSRAGMLARCEMAGMHGKVDTPLMAYLFACDREESLTKGAAFATLANGGIVVCGRGRISNMVYQWENSKIVERLNERLPWPRKVFFLDAEPDLAYERQALREGAGRGSRLDIVPFEQLLKLRVRFRACLDLLEERGPRKLEIVRVDAALPAFEIACMIYESAILPEVMSLQEGK